MTTTPAPALLCAREAVLAPVTVLVRPKDSINQRGKRMKQKLSEMVQVTVLIHTFPRLVNKFFFCLTDGNGYHGYQTAPRASQLSAWGTLATSGAGMVCHV